MKSFLKSPFVRSCLRFSGSLKLAMLLMAVLIAATIVGTFVESRFDTSVAQIYVYDAPWFLAWLALLCINLTGAVLVRYPWKPHQWGFIITHAGIVVMLIGAIVGRIWGFEGSMTLFKGQQPVDYLLTGLQTLEARAPGDSEPARLTLNLNKQQPTEARPAVTEAGQIQVAAIGFAPEVGLRNHIEPGEGGRPALRLVMNSSMSSTPLDRWLVLDDADAGTVQFGPTVIRYVSEPATAAAAVKSTTARQSAVPSRELHFAFAKIPQMNTARPVTGPATGMKTSYEFSREIGGDHKGVLKLFIDGKTFSFPVAESLGREVGIANTGLKLKVSNYFADFRMNGKQPASISDQPNNPAVLFEILGPPVVDTASAQCAHHQSGSCAHGDAETGCSMAANGCSHEGATTHGTDHQHNDQTPKASSELFIYRNAEGNLRFVTHVRGQQTSGDIALGKAFTPGLADWVCRVSELTDSAVMRQEFAPADGFSVQSAGAAGLQVRLTKAGQSRTQWIRMGATTPIDFAGEKVDLMFGHKLHKLDFTLELEKFEVEMNEGTRTPASFKSFVKFHDPKSQTTLTRAIWMNNPGNFPEFTGAALLGTTYKFSQSSWNPNNLNETTLQVIRDPGWSFKWIGSLMLCAGLVTMFYVKPYPRFAKAKARAAVPVPVTSPNTPMATPSEVLVGK